MIFAEVVGLDGADRDSRVFLSSDEGNKGIKTGAIVTDSAFFKHLVNFFMKVSFGQSKLPAKGFSDKAEASYLVKNI